MKVGVELAGMMAASLEAPVSGEWEQRCHVRQFVRRFPHHLHEVRSTLVGLTQLSPKKQQQLLDYCTQIERVLPEWIGGIVHKAGFKGLIADEAKSYHVWIVYLDSSGNRPLVRRLEVQRGKVKPHKFHVDAKLSYELTPEVIFVDSPHGYAKIKQLMETGEDSVVMVAPAYEAAKSGLEVYAKKIATALGGLPVKPTSSLPLTKIQQRAAARAENPKPTLKPAEKERLYAEEQVALTSWGEDGTSLYEKHIAFKDVPSNAHFYMPAPCARNPNLYEFRLGSTRRELGEDQVRRVIRALQSLRAIGVPVPEIGGYMYPQHAQARKFRLKERGWQTLPEVIEKCMQAPAVVKAISQRVLRLPDLALEGHRHWITSKNAGVLGSLCEAAWRNRDLQDWLFAALKELPELDKLFRPLWDANVLNGKSRNADAPIQAIIDEFQSSIPGFEYVRMGGDEFEAEVLKSYPELRYVKDEQFFGAWEEDKERIGALRLLHLIFDPG